MGSIDCDTSQILAIVAVGAIASTLLFRIPCAATSARTTDQSSVVEIDADWLIRCAARRQKWIDMAQSLNLYLDRPSGRRLSDMYQLAWETGLKTTYYLRATGAGGVEASTVDVNKRGIQPHWMKSVSASSQIRVDRGEDGDTLASAPLPATACDIDGTCEACQ